MLSAIADNNPVLIFEHRWLMKKDGLVPEGVYKVPIGKGIYRRRGRDLTIVGASHAIELGATAANEMAAEGIDAEVIDLRTIKPLDIDIIEESVKNTGRLLVVDTGWSMGGVCAEIGCLAAERWLDCLKAPVRRIGLPDIPTPAGFTLEQFYYPDVDRISATIRDLVRTRSPISVS
jgi:pyruvate dehydrogenase E1 component beta subunit